MLYEVELRRHRETHRLFSATSSQLAQWREEREKRIVSFKRKKFIPEAVGIAVRDGGLKHC